MTRLRDIQPSTDPRREDPCDYVKARVDIDEQGCWNWRLAVSPNGYGLCNRQDWRGGAHRFSYVAFVGPIAEGLHLDHLCRNRRCVNPAHLEPVSTTENVRRGHAALRGRNHSLFLDNRTQLWTASVEVSASPRVRKSFRSKSREVAESRLLDWIAKNGS